MEPWKIGAIVAIVAGFIGFSVFTKGGQGGILPGPTVAAPTPGPSVTYTKYFGKSIPSLTTMTQWANTPAPVDLATLKGKPTLVEVFRVECSHCQEAAPYLVQLHARYAPRGVNFIGIQSPGNYKDPENPENNWTGVKDWLKSHRYTWPVAFDENSKWFQGNIGDTVTYPTMFLLDKTGKAIFIQTGHDNDKAIKLAVELEKLAPGKGDVNANAADLSRFLNIGLGGSESMQKDLEKQIVTDLKAKA